MEALRKIFGRIIELSDLLIYSSTDVPKDLKKLEKKVEKDGVGILLKYQMEDYNE